MKVLNLYSGIGGNRKLWKDVEVTAVENNEEIAGIYQDFFPDDKVVVADAHQYLLDHYKEFDFIWSSRPCGTHSEIRRCRVYNGQNKPAYPDMKLYEEIIFLKYFSVCPYVVENVVSYYKPLIKPQKVGRHYFWTNFPISNIELEKPALQQITGTQVVFGFDLRPYKLKHRKDQILRNCVHPKLGLHVFECAFKKKQLTLDEVD